MTIDEWLGLQHKLQVESFGTDPTVLEADARADWVTWNVVALTDELHEAMGEVGWKPWLTEGRGAMNRSLYLKELVDAMHFLANLILVADPQPGEIAELYLDKRQVNADRQADGYDGKLDKCPSCKRSLTDTGVETVPIVLEHEVAFISVQCAACWHEIAREEP